MKRTLAFIIILISMVGCFAMAESVISNERFVEFFGSVDVDDDTLTEIIRRNNITESELGSLTGINKSLFRNKVLSIPYDMCYSYLFSGNSIVPSAQENVICFATSYPSGNMNESILVDMVSRRFYYDSARQHFDNVSESEVQGDLTDEQLQALTDLFASKQWESYKTEYGVADNTSESSSAWTMAVETENGIIQFKVYAGTQDAPIELTVTGKEVIDIVLGK